MIISRRRTFTALLLLLGFILQAQTLYSVMEKKTVALGEPAVYKIRIENLQGKPVALPGKNELLPYHFEEISDSTTTDGETFERVIEFAVFQEGDFEIPAFDVGIGSDTSRTVPYRISVINTAQKGDKIHDIKPNQEVALDLANYWSMYKWYVLMALAVIILLILYFVLRKFFRRKIKETASPSNVTLRKLEKLRKKGLIEKLNYRAFYIELGDITREFIKLQYHVAADVLLTEDLINQLRDNQTISLENEKVVHEILHRGDLVKFAKAFPTVLQMESDFSAVKTFVKHSIKDLEFEKLRKDV